MKKIFIFILIIAGTLNQLLAQVSPQFNYQAIVRNNAGNTVVSENVKVNVEILKGSTTGNSVFKETHTVLSNTQGVISFNIGSTADLTVVKWKEDNFFLKVIINDEVLSTTQFLAVPYVIHAQWAETTDFNKVTNTPSIGDLDTDANNKRITNVGTPIDANDAATKSYVDSVLTPISRLARPQFIVEYAPKLIGNKVLLVCNGEIEKVTGFEKNFYIIANSADLIPVTKAMVSADDKMTIELTLESTPKATDEIILSYIGTEIKCIDDRKAEFQYLQSFNQEVKR